jgi:pilus assembly protein CpaE
VALRQQSRADVLLLDADVGVGNVTSVLQVPFRRGLRDLADSPPADWTEGAFEQLVCEHAESGLRVVSWGNDPGDSERVSVDLMLAALKWARRRHAYVVVDNHPGYDDRTMAMLIAASRILLVVTPEVGPLKNSAQFVELARQVGLAEHIRVVANRANHGVKVAQMAETLGLPVMATIVSNGPKAVVAANEGRPLIMKFPREKISTDMYNVARALTRPALVAPDRRARRWWPRFASRTSQA